MLNIFTIAGEQCLFKIACVHDWAKRAREGAVHRWPLDSHMLACADLMMQTASRLVLYVLLFIIHMIWLERKPVFLIIIRFTVTLLSYLHYRWVQKCFIWGSITRKCLKSPPALGRKKMKNVYIWIWFGVFKYGVLIVAVWHGEPLMSSVSLDQENLGGGNPRNPWARLLVSSFTAESLTDECWGRSWKETVLGKSFWVNKGQKEAGRFYLLW